ncbi:MAG: putative deacetylase [Armatimonadetes bacterium]|jgi:acetoin utilization deacetylase AcuC-like enzyme|nr:putative deacetylase [Armatimonadota bacterium]
MTPGILYDPVVLEHDTGRHPETAARISTVVALLRERGLWDRLQHLPVKPAPLAAVEAVHDPRYVELIRYYAERGGGWLTGDTPFSAGSWDAALAGSGAAIGAVDAVLRREVPSAFALIRPPGHHACIAEGMGFCLLNHAAIAARHAVRTHGLNRVLLVDFDVHHGNGTQEIFYEDPSVLYFSMHQYPAYPGTGAAREIGAGAGIGTTVNVPLPAGVADAGHLYALHEMLVPVAREYRPQLILVSAGYDSHWANTAYLNSIRMCVSVSGFGQWVTLLQDLANELCDGRLAFSLEGGYDHEALAWSVDATFRVLLGEPVEDPLGPGSHRSEPPIDDLIADYRRLHGLEA